MPIHALDAVDDAVGPTRSLVARLRVADWLKLAAVTLFVGGLGSISFSANLPRELVRALPGDLPAVVDPWQAVGTAGVVVAVGLVLTAVYLVRSLLEFVFYAALRDGHVAVRRSLARWWLHGVQLWGLRVALAWSLLAGGAAAASAVSGGGVPTFGLPARGVAVAVVALSFGVHAVIAGFTTRFVVPVVLVREVGVLAAWGRFARTLGAAPGQFVWYLLVAPLLRFVADVLALSAAVLVAAVLAVPVVVFTLPVLLVVGAEPWLALSPSLVLLTAGLAAWYVLLVVVGALVVRLPFLAYVRYYALAVLRGVDPELDLFA